MMTPVAASRGAGGRWVRGCSVTVLWRSGSGARFWCAAMALPVVPHHRTSPSAGPMSQMGH